MNKYLKVDPWMIIEDGFDIENHKSSESIFSIGNGNVGQRANFEEAYSGPSLQGTYVAGVYYPDKTKVGWWKNGYPEYFAKVLNSTNFIGIDVVVNGEKLDLARCKVLSFQRILNMKEGTLSREFVVRMLSGIEIQVSAIRFLSMATPESGVVRYSVKPLSDSCELELTPFLDGNVVNEDANWDDVFWDQLVHKVDGHSAYLVSKTKKTGFVVANGMHTTLFNKEKEISIVTENESREGFVCNKYVQHVTKNTVLEVTKYIVVLSSLNHPEKSILEHTKNLLAHVTEQGFENMLASHKNKWKAIWEHSDIIIEGDAEAQQGIRFNIFHLNQTYTGEDERLNVGPKGFTGEKYGGASYWDTEAYCLPFFLATAPQIVSRNLLLYRYKHLQKAIENAEKLGFSNGAALFPMVTMNGEECHNEWEITFEEIHRNGAIAYAIYNYIVHTGDKQFLVDYGLEVLIAISRFWAQRVNYSQDKKKYVMLGVTGPNEYENNVNNNWYTNLLAQWTLNYTIECIAYVRKKDDNRYQSLKSAIRFNEEEEQKTWKVISKNLYFPELGNGIFLQQDGYMDKEQITVDQLDVSQRPINQKWSWDRILRSCFIKQADVLQGIYFFQQDYSDEIIEKNFDFYEPRTVHESSLSPCVHVVLASRINRIEKAYELYLRTSRLDLDDYNNEVNEGLHITSMAGTYMAVIEGFAGKRIFNNKLVLNPAIPEKWKSFSFKILFRKSQLHVRINSEDIQIRNESDFPAEISLYQEDYTIQPNSEIKTPYKPQK
jgi:maltose phosphorylase